ncbi:hypothetical protein CDIK_2377 [Cucumispora dikerogammari]|nr:hypothetical protein CDIK_2377 [Cucumispora dikerogammari]
MSINPHLKTYINNKNKTTETQSFYEKLLTRRKELLKTKHDLEELSILKKDLLIKKNEKLVLIQTKNNNLIKEINRLKKKISEKFSNIFLLKECIYYYRQAYYKSYYSVCYNEYTDIVNEVNDIFFLIKSGKNYDKVEVFFKFKLLIEKARKYKGLYNKVVDVVVTLYNDIVYNVFSKPYEIFKAEVISNIREIIGIESVFNHEVSGTNVGLQYCITDIDESATYSPSLSALSGSAAQTLSATAGIDYSFTHSTLSADLLSADADKISASVAATDDKSSPGKQSINRLDSFSSAISGPVADNNKEGSVTANNKEGSVTANNKEGSVAANNKEGSVAANNKEGSVTVNNKEGSVAANNKEGSVAANNKEGSAALFQPDNTHRDYPLLHFPTSLSIAYKKTFFEICPLTLITPNNIFLEWEYENLNEFLKQSYFLLKTYCVLKTTNRSPYIKKELENFKNLYYTNNNTTNQTLLIKTNRQFLETIGEIFDIKFLNLVSSLNKNSDLNNNESKNIITEFIKKYLNFTDVIFSFFKLKLRNKVIINYFIKNELITIKENIESLLQNPIIKFSENLFSYLNLDFNQKYDFMFRVNLFVYINFIDFIKEIWYKYLFNIIEQIKGDDEITKFFVLLDIIENVNCVFEENNFKVVVKWGTSVLPGIVDNDWATEYSLFSPTLADDSNEGEGVSSLFIGKIYTDDISSVVATGSSLLSPALAYYSKEGEDGVSMSAIADNDCATGPSADAGLLGGIPSNARPHLFTHLSIITYCTDQILLNLTTRIDKILQEIFILNTNDELLLSNPSNINNSINNNAHNSINNNAHNSINTIKNKILSIIEQTSTACSPLDKDFKQILKTHVPKSLDSIFKSHYNVFVTNNVYYKIVNIKIKIFSRIYPYKLCVQKIIKTFEKVNF